MRKINALLLTAASNVDDRELQLILLWESNALGLDQLIKVSPEEGRVSTAVGLQACLPSLSPSLVFATTTGHVGEYQNTQLSLNRLSPNPLAGFALKEIKIAFDGGINPVLLTMQSSSQSSDDHSYVAKLHVIELSENDAANQAKPKRLSVGGVQYWTNVVDCNFDATPSCNVYEFSVIPRETGTVTVASIALLLANETQELTINATDFTDEDAKWWELRSGHAEARNSRVSNTSNILPKPPKAEIEVPGLSSNYYTNEEISLEVMLRNCEDDIISGSLQARLIGPATKTVQLRWQSESGDSSTVSSEPNDLELQPLQVVDMYSGTTKSIQIQVTGLLESVDYELELQLTYTLAADTTNSLVKTTVIDLPVVRPFEANAFFIPRPDNEQWPDFFVAPTTGMESVPTGLKQKYLVRADLASFAHEDLEIKQLELIARKLVGDATSTSSYGTLSEMEELISQPVKVPPEATRQFFFDLEIQKQVLGNRIPVSVEYAIDIHWSRSLSSSDRVNVSTLILPKFLAPMAEPRVLLQVHDSDSEDDVYMLTYTIENPSMHFLTFNISLESGDGFAFSGPKTKSISMVPISRYTIEYRILMQRNNEWIGVNLTVLDAFFGQTLRVLPASDGVRADKGHIQVWSKALR